MEDTPWYVSLIKGRMVDRKPILEPENYGLPIAGKLNRNSWKFRGTFLFCLFLTRMHRSTATGGTERTVFESRMSSRGAT